MKNIIFFIIVLVLVLTSYSMYKELKRYKKLSGAYAKQLENYEDRADRLAETYEKMAAEYDEIIKNQKVINITNNKIIRNQEIKIEGLKKTNASLTRAYIKETGGKND